MATNWKAQNRFYRKYLYSLMQTYQSRSDLRIFTEIILSLSAISLFGLLAIKPTLVTIASLITDIGEKERVIAILDQKIQDLSLAQEVYQSQIETLALLDTSIPLEPLPQKYIRQLEAISATNAVKLSTIQTENIALKGVSLESSAPSEQDEFVATFPNEAQPIGFSMTAVGTFENIQKFLSDIEKLRMPMVIDSTSLGESEDDGTTLSAIIHGRIAYIKS